MISMVVSPMMSPAYSRAGAVTSAIRQKAEPSLHGFPAQIRFVRDLEHDLAARVMGRGLFTGFSGFAQRENLAHGGLDFLFVDQLRDLRQFVPVRLRPDRGATDPMLVQFRLVRAP